MAGGRRKGRFSRSTLKSQRQNASGVPPKNGPQRLSPKRSPKQSPKPSPKHPPKQLSTYSLPLANDEAKCDDGVKPYSEKSLLKCSVSSVSESRPNIVRGGSSDDAPTCGSVVFVPVSSVDRSATGEADLSPCLAGSQKEDDPMPPLSLAPAASESCQPRYQQLKRGDDRIDRTMMEVSPVAVAPAIVNVMDDSGSCSALCNNAHDPLHRSNEDNFHQHHQGDQQQKLDHEKGRFQQHTQRTGHVQFQQDLHHQPVWTSATTPSPPPTSEDCHFMSSNGRKSDCMFKAARTATPVMFSPPPTVPLAISELWHIPPCAPHLASRWMQILHHAILSEHEEQQHCVFGVQSADETFGGEYTGCGYDPYEAFLCIQSTAMRFQEHWELRREASQERKSNRFKSWKQRFQMKRQRRRSGKKQSVKEQRAKGREVQEKSNGSNDPVTDSEKVFQENSNKNILNGGSDTESFSSDDKDSMADCDHEALVQWEQDELEVWNVWEESIWAAAALAKACVGPAWRYQLRQRRDWARLGTTGLLQNQQNVPPAQRHRPSSMDGSASSLGMGSANANARGDQIAPPQQDNTSSSGLSTGEDDTLSATPDSASFISNTQSTVPLVGEARHASASSPHHHIPEGLPLAMLRFAASAGDSALPPIRQASFTVPAADCASHQVDKILPGSCAPAAIAIVRDEQRWLIRRQRMGEAQRELVVALCVVPVDADTTANCEDDGRAKQWTIPGAHGPVASMLVSWLETAKAGWPSEKASSYSMDDLVSKDDESNVAKGMADNEKNEKERNIKGAGNDGGQTAVLWSNLVDIGAIDWWYALQVTRAITDLVSAGWRPPQRGSLSQGVLLGLLSIAEKGLLLLPSDMKCAPLAIDQEAREERLAASSSAAEALSALLALGTRNHIPLSVLSLTGTTLCRLLAVADPSMSAVSTSVYPTGKACDPAEEEAWRLEKDTFLSQRESCLADTAELVWGLLAHHSSACATVAAFLRVMAINLTASPVPTSEQARADSFDPNDVLAAGGAIRALGAALWGNPPHVNGVPSLRIYWSVFLGVLGDVASTVHGQVESLEVSTVGLSDKYFKKKLVGYDKVSGTAGRLLSLQESSPSSLIVILEIAVAIRRLVDGELVPGAGVLSPHEWDELNIALESLVPWLDRNYATECLLESNPDTDHWNQNVVLCRRIKIEVRAIFLQIECFLNSCADIDESAQGTGSFAPPIHLIVDADCRDRFHLVLLEKASPLMSPNQAKSLVRAVVRSWVTVCHLPHRGGDWCRKSSELLSYVFGLYSERRKHGYIGGYVHAPTVRLEALRALTHERLDLIVSPSKTSKTCETASFTTRNCLATLSPLELTKNMREPHLEFINSVVLPHLVAMLTLDGFDMPLGENVANVAIFPVYEHGEETCQENREFPLELEEEYALRNFVVQLIGKLFRSLTGDRRHRVMLIQMLQSIATNSGLSKTRSEIFDDIDMSFGLCLGAVHQLELCLRVPFETLPHTHANVPDCIEALCTVVRAHSNVLRKKCFPHFRAQMLLTLAPLLTLARIAVAQNGRMVMLGAKNIFKCIHPDIISLVACEKVSRKECLGQKMETTHECYLGGCDIEHRGEERSESLTAPFVFVQLESISGPGTASKRPSLQRTSENTTVSLNPIISVMSFVLQNPIPDDSMSTAVRNAKHTTLFDGSFDVDDVESSIRCVCFDTLHAFIVMGVPVNLGNAFNSTFCASMITKTSKECTARSRAIASYAGCCVDSDLSIRQTCASQGPGGTVQTNSQLDQEGSVVDKLIELCLSNNAVEVIHGCRGLSLMLTSVVTKASLEGHSEVSSESWIHSACDALLSRLTSLCNKAQLGICSSLNSEGMDEKENARQITFELMVPLLAVLFDIFSKRRKLSLHLQTVSLCHRICSVQVDNKVFLQGRLLALQCAASAISSMTSEEALHVFYSMKSSADAPELDNKKEKENASSVSQLSTKIVVRNECDVSRLSSVIFDMLMCRQLGRKSAPSSHQERSASFVASTCLVHEAIAKQTEDVEQFLVDGMNAQGFAAWLCGDAILTCRVGAPRTRYRGWVELIVRFPTCRLRRLVRLSDHNSVKNPELPNSLYSMIQPGKFHPSPGTTRQEEAGTTYGNIMSFCTSPSSTDAGHCTDENDSEVITRALSVIQRFDVSHVRPGLNCNLSGFLPDRSKRKARTISDGVQSMRSDPDQEGAAQLQKWDDGAKSISAISGNTTGTHERKLQRSHSTGHIFGDIPNSLALSKPIQGAEGDTKSMPSIHSWLTSVFKNSPISIGDVETELRLLGFSTESLGLSDSFVDNERPSILQFPLRPLQAGPKLHRAISLLDRTATMQTHKIALLFANPATGRGENVTSECTTLNATHCSPEFLEFSEGLGSLVLTRHLKYFSGGLDTSVYAADGTFALAWIGNIETDQGEDLSMLPKAMVLFHAVNLMPPGNVNRKRHVGNDVVQIIFVEKSSAGISRNSISDQIEDEDKSTIISGEFGFVTIFVVPLAKVELVRVTLRTKPELATEMTSALAHLVGSTIIPKPMAAVYVRQMAIKADLVCRSIAEDRLGLASNWEQRLILIREMDRYLSDT